MLRVGIIGVGNMGSKYAKLIGEGEIEGLEIGALTRVNEKFRETVKSCLEKNIPVYESADALFEAVEEGSLKLDAVIIATPHIAHEAQAVRAFKNNLHVLSDKPSGVYTRQARNMEEAAAKYNKKFGMVFNQRTNPLYIRMKEIIDSGIYGSLKRVNWVVTDWYRPEKYFASSSWHASWGKDGGGVLLNQCPHNLDLLQWICSMPSELQGFCINGHFHNIEVEDDVTAYLRWPNGATGTFITSTGDAPGINRLEISLDEAMLVCENGELRIGELYPELGMKEADYMASSEDYFRKIKGSWKVEQPEKITDAYRRVLQGFSDACLGKGEMIAEGSEGRLSLMISNAIYLSSWKGRMITLPQIGSREELEFEKEFEEEFNKIKQHSAMSN